MEQKLIRVDSNEASTKLAEMNKNGFRLIAMRTIPATYGTPDAHGVSYGDNEQMEMLFEK